jgi:hypothetical protein
VTIGAKARGRWRFSTWTAGILFGGPIELETRGNLRDWMVMSEGERIEALHALWSSGLRRQREMADEGPPLSRQARTSLGYGVIGPRESLDDDLEIHGGSIVSGSTVPGDGEWILYAPRSPGEKGKEDD